MKTQQAYSLCDAMELALSPSPLLPPEAALLYVGSYFCDRYFCTTPESVWEAAFALAQGFPEGAVLVVPTPSQAQLERVKEVVLRLAEKHAGLLREIVLNDYAMLRWAQEALPSLPRWCGRAMSKDFRDPRYPLPSQRIKLLDTAENSNLMNLQVLGVEADPVNPLSLPQDRNLLVAVHVPLAYVTMGRLCEFGSIGKPLDQKFRPGGSCSRQCTDNWLIYENRGFSFVKCGRAVYTSNKHIQAELPDGQLRIIHSALANCLQTAGGEEAKR